MKLSKALLKTTYRSLRAIEKQHPHSPIFIQGEVGYMTIQKHPIDMMTFSTGERHAYYPLGTHSLFDVFLGYVMIDSEHVIKVYRSMIPKTWIKRLTLDQPRYQRLLHRLNTRFQKVFAWYHVPRRTFIK